MNSKMVEWTKLRFASRQQEGTPLPDINLSSRIVDSTLGKDKISPLTACDIYEEVFLAWAWVLHGGELDSNYCESLENRAKDETVLWPIATRIHVQQSIQRETRSRAILSIQQIPFSLPNSLDSLQVEIFASGDRVLNALHIDWVRKLSGHLLDVLILDCRHLGLWFEPILDVLPESSLRRALRKVPRARRLQEGSLGLGAYYAWRINMRTDIFFKKATDLDKEIFQIACSAMK